MRHIAFTAIGKWGTKMNGLWDFSPLLHSVRNDANLTPGRLLFEDGHIRSVDTPSTLVGHYRVRGEELTCFLRHAGQGPTPPPIVQLNGEIKPDAIDLHGALVSYPKMKLGAKLVRPKSVGASTRLPRAEPLQVLAPVSEP